MHDITVRQMDFTFPEDIDPVCVEGEPEESYGSIGFSLLLPYLEPYLIRTMKQAKSHVSDPELLADMGKFSAQEGQHYRQHRRFNDVIRTKGFDRLKEFEDELDADYRRFTSTKSLKFNLAYAEGFEAFTTATARFSFEQGFAEGMHPAVRDLFAWHLVEELEHRTVAFDVYDHVCGRYFYRLFVGLFAQWHMLRFTFRVARYMLDADVEALPKYGGRAGRRARLRKQRAMAARHLLPKVLWTYSPWYTPHKIEMPAEMRALARHYSEMAVSTS